MHGRLSNWRWCCQSASRFGLEAPELRPRGLEGSRRGVERYLQLAAATTTTGSSARGTIMRWLRAFLHPVYRRGTVHAEPYEVRCKVTANPSKLSARDLQAAAAVRRPATRGGCYSYFFFFPPATWAVRSWPSAMFTFTRAFYRFFLFFHRLIRSSIASFYTTMFRRKFDQ